MNTNSVTHWLGSWLLQAVLRRAPQDDRLSYEALVAALFVYFCADLLQAAGHSSSGTALAVTLMDMLVMVLFTWMVLLIANRAARLTQTLTALAGTGAVVGLAGLPLVLAAARVQQPDVVPQGFAVGWLAMMVWDVAVRAHIFRHALASPFGLGLVVAGLHTVVAIGFLEYFFPGFA